MTEDRRAELLQMISEFVMSTESRINFPSSMTGHERKVLHQEAERQGCSAQSYAYGRGSERVLTLFKGTRFHEGLGVEPGRVSEACVNHDSQQSDDISECPSSSDASPEVIELTCNSYSDACNFPPAQMTVSVPNGETEFLPTSTNGAGVAQSALFRSEPQASVWQDCSAASLDIVLHGAFRFLVLPEILHAGRICRCWRALTMHVPIEVKPCQAVAVLQFCLLEVLCDYSDSRLPLPWTAVFGDMRRLVRRLYRKPSHCSRLADAASSQLGCTDRIERLRVLQVSFPHHVAWPRACSDLRHTGFKTLEKMGRHFQAEQLVEVSMQRWRARVHHTPNMRSCKELMLTHIGWQHPLLMAHIAWRESVSCGLRCTGL